MLWEIDWQTVQRMLIDTVDTNEENNNSDKDFDFDSNEEIEVNDDNIESIMKGLEKYK